MPHHLVCVENEKFTLFPALRAPSTAPPIDMHGPRRCASHTSRRYIVDRTPKPRVMCVAGLAAPRLAAGSAPEMAARTGGSLSHLTRLFTPTATARRRTASPGARERRAGRRSVWGSRLGVTRQAACDAAAARVERQDLAPRPSISISAGSRLYLGSLGALLASCAESLRKRAAVRAGKPKQSSTPATAPSTPPRYGTGRLLGKRARLTPLRPARALGGVLGT